MPRKTKRTPPAGYDLHRAGAAQYLGLPITTLNDWAYRRVNLPYCVIGGAAWYRRSDCDRLIARRERKVS